MRKEYVIIVAGGKGERMNSEIPKQFIPLLQKPILMHTIEKFKQYNNNIEIVLVLPQNQIEYWKDLCQEYQFSIMHTITSGGKTRFESVKNGLKMLPQKEQSLIAIHDGVRPLIDKKNISTCFETAEETGTAIPTVNITDSIRKIEGEKSKIVNRDDFRLVQTPQVFHSGIILKSYQQKYQTHFTDDASVVENLGYEVTLTEGNKKNIKITTEEDLAIATVWLKETR